MTRIGKVTFKRGHAPLSKLIYPTVYENGYAREAIFEVIFVGENRVIYRRVA